MIGKGTGLGKTLLLSTVSFALTLAVYLSGGLAFFEFKAYDLFSRQLNPPRSPGDIVIVKIDQPSLDYMKDLSSTWPWPREIYSYLFEYLSQADAVFFDVLTTESSSYGVSDDAILAQAIRKAGNIYLPVFLTTNPREIDRAGRDFLTRIALPATAPEPRLSYPSVLLPVADIREHCRGAGNVVINPDADGVYRRVPLNFTAEGLNLPCLILGNVLEQGVLTAKRNGFYRAGKRLPLQGDSLLLRFYRSGSDFSSYSAADLLMSFQNEREGKKPIVPRDFFKGKKVFIGLTAAGLYDLKPTAVSSVSTGVMVHATLLDNLLHGNLMTPLSRYYVVFFMLLVSLAATWFILTHLSLAANLTFIGCATAFVVAVPAILFRNALYLEIIPPVMALGVSSLAAAAYSYATEGKERRFVRRTFSQYMDETLVQHVLKNPELIRPGGERRKVAVFFLDIAGFTAMAEKHTVEETTRILHTVLNAFSEVVIRNHGVIDKYIGDCIMAFWGAPLESGQDESNACRAALECLETLAVINRGFREDGLPEIAVRIGIHSGEVIVGNLGSDRLFDYTVVGDTVNLASRLESANKRFRTRIMVSSDVYDRTGDVFLARELGLIEVKGKTQPVRIYEISAVRETCDGPIAERVALHGRAMACFYEKRWQEAGRLFDRLLEIDPEDGPATYYREWCGSLEQHPPVTDGWHIIRMTEK